MDCGMHALSIAEKLGAPILTTTAGKGAVPAHHPLVWGYMLAQPEVQNILQQSDCVLAVGSELSETDFWDTQVVIAKNLIRVDIDPAAIARPHTAEIPILGDAKETLEALAPLITARAAQPKPKIAKGEDDELRIMLSKVLGTIREALPEDTVIASDMTQIAYAANIIFPMYVPRTWLHPVGFGTLGFGLPAGIGAKFGVGKKPVAIMIGDYGIQFTINELGTAAEHKLPVVILMWNNNALGQIRDPRALWVFVAILKLRDETTAERQFQLEQLRQAAALGMHRIGDPLGGPNE